MSKIIGPYQIESENGEKFPNGLLIIKNSSKNPYVFYVNNLLIKNVIGNSVFIYYFKADDLIMKIVQESGFIFKATEEIQEVPKGNDFTIFWEIP